MSKNDRAQVYPVELSPPSQFPAKTRLPVPGDPSDFTVLSATYLVSDRRHDEPLSRPIYGQIADVPGWGRLIRWAIQGRVAPCYGYRRIDPLDSDKAPEGLRTPIDEVASTLSELETLSSNPRSRLREIEVSPLEGELLKFKTAWPLIAEKLGLARLRPPRLFDPGNRVLIPQAFDPRVGDVDWQGFLDRHLSGDFGQIGSYAPPPTDDASLFAIDLLPRPVRNSFAVSDRAGLILSVFPLDAAPTAGLAVVARTVLGTGSQDCTAMVIRSAAHFA